MAELRVGPLWRFYAADRAEGVVRDGVLAWRERALAALDGFPRAALAGAAEREEPLEVFDADAVGLVALRLWAFYGQRTELDWPETVPPVAELDRAWREAADGGFAGSHYAHLLVPELWLPGDFAFTARMPMPDGEDREVGSVGLAKAQLARLNRSTFDAEGDELREWIREPAPVGATFVEAVRRGIGAMAAALARAQQLGLPMAAGAVGPAGLGP